MNEGKQAEQEAARPLSMMASREPYWEEASPEQKIERLRETVARLCNDVTVLTANLVHVCAHRHGENGELLTPFQPINPRANYAGSALANGLYAHDNGIPHNLRTQRERR